jgi:hypothetical protein
VFKLQVRVARSITHRAKMLAAVIGASVIVAMGLLTAAVGGTEAQAQSGPGGGMETMPASTQGQAPAAPNVPSAAPKHVPAWKCWDIFTSLC